MPRRDEPKRYQMPMESSAVGRIDARLDTLTGLVSFAKGETTLVAGTTAVAITGIPSNAIVIVSPKTLLGTVGILSWAITPDTLTITSVSALDVSVVNYVVFNP